MWGKWLTDDGFIFCKTEIVYFSQGVD